METPLRPRLTSAILAAASLAVIASPPAANANVALEWTFESLNWGTNPPGAPPSTVANVITGLQPEINPGHLTAAASLVHNPPTGTAFVVGWTGNGSNRSLSSDHWNMNDYYEFDVPANMYSSLSFSMTGGFHSPGYFRISYSRNNGPWTYFDSVFPNGSNWTPTAADPASTYWFDLSNVPGLTGIRVVDSTNGNVTSSLYPRNNENTIDDVTFSIAPEPASAVAIAPAAFILARRRRKNS